jgi:hypothetical protein
VGNTWRSLREKFCQKLSKVTVLLVFFPFKLVMYKFCSLRVDCDNTLEVMPPRFIKIRKQ